MVGPALSPLVFPREVSVLTAGLPAGGGALTAVGARETRVGAAAWLAGLLFLARGALMAFGGVTGGREDVRPVTSVEDTDLSLDRAIPFSLLLDQLVSNALKHGGRKDVIEVPVGPAGNGATFVEVRGTGFRLVFHADRPEVNEA